MDLGGFEPPASSVRLKRAPNCATGPFLQGEKILPEAGMDVKVCIIIKECSNDFSRFLHVDTDLDGLTLKLDLPEVMCYTNASVI